MVFLDFEVWVKDFKIFNLRFGFLVKNCIYFTPPEPKQPVGANFNNGGWVITWTSGLAVFKTNTKVPYVYAPIVKSTI